MGPLALRRLTGHRDGQRCQQQILAQNGLIASSVNKRKGSPCQQDGDSSFFKENGDCGSQDGETMIRSDPDLPEDIWHHIHSLMPLPDAARAACLSHSFLRSWRCYPNLTFNGNVFSPEGCIYGGDISHTVDCIMRNHSGTGVKILKLESLCTTRHNLNTWLRVAVKPGIEELTLRLHIFKKKYKFPCSLLSDGVRDSIQYLELACCSFHPTAEIGRLKSLTSLHLSHVGITGDELECLLSNALALEELELVLCKGIICLRIPCELQRLSWLRIFACGRLELIESKAPNLSTLEFCGDPKISLGEALPLKSLKMSHSNVCYARTELPSTIPNLETLELRSYDEVVNTPMLPTKFLCLKHLTISLRGPLPWSYDYFSLVSFIDASPSLETLNLDVAKKPVEHELFSGHSKDLRQMGEDHHCYLKNVKITGFSGAKGLVELARYILKNAVSLECLALDTNYGSTRECSNSITRRCNPRGIGLTKARRPLLAIRRYIEGKVPARVKLTVVEPCSRCHKLS